MRSLPSFAATTLLLALAACRDEPSSGGPSAATTATQAAPPVTALPAASAAPLPSAEPLASAEPTASAAPTAAPEEPKDAGAPKPDAGKPKPDAGAPKPDPKTASADAGAADAAAPTPAPTAAPAPGSADAVAAEVDKIYLGKNTFQANFKQQHTQKVTGTVKKSSGVLYFERPNRISFRYDPPSKNRIVSDGSQLKVYIADDNQMFVQAVDKSEYPGALAFLMGKGLAPSFSFSFHDKSKFAGGPVLLGKPRQPTPHYEQVYFYVDKVMLEKKDPGVIRRVMLVDVQGNRNQFDFENAKQPEKIDPAEFTFTPPAGTSIVQN
jgi:outer membrane lipoprotein carrier protein